MGDSNSRLVYSTEQGRICPGCGKMAGKCACRKKTQASKQASKNDGIVRVSRETKGRKGKGVTLVTGVPLDPDGLKKLAKELKQKCGTGGTLKGCVIEIQGDHREVLVADLSKRGYVVKKAGG